MNGIGRVKYFNGDPTPAERGRRTAGDLIWEPLPSARAPHGFTQQSDLSSAAPGQPIRWARCRTTRPPPELVRVPLATCRSPWN